MPTASELVWVELSPHGCGAIRIFRTRTQAVTSSAYTEARVVQQPYYIAVSNIRALVMHRDQSACVHCGELVTWGSGEMHERQWRGQIKQISEFEYQGGEISVSNSETRCHNCHTGPGGAHDRNPKWSGQ
jgi:hypothetical protein